jgi:ABC-type multidrug transport system ATPase subunit
MCVWGGWIWFIRVLVSILDLDQPAQHDTQVLEEMRLGKCADTLVGGGDFFFSQKGISGGERKRLAIGCELLLAPSTIFLDEPSSGACD